jgi:hypothetical protein
LLNARLTHLTHFSSKLCSAIICIISDSVNALGV